jgi:hypothetical protein
MVVILSSNSEGCIVCIICKLTHLWGAAFHVSCCVRQVKGLYKGATSAFVGVALESSVLFGAYSQAKAALQGQEEPGRKPSLYAVVPAAAFAGASVSAIVCPTELVKCRLQVQEKRSTIHVPGVHHYDGPFDCVRKIVKYEGVRGSVHVGFFLGCSNLHLSFPAWTCLSDTYVVCSCSWIVFLSFSYIFSLLDLT